MRSPSNDPFSFAVTNPLHYVYYENHATTRSVIANGSLASDTVGELGFANVISVPAANSVKGLIEADDGYAGPYISWRSADVSKPMLGNPYDVTSKIESKVAIRSIIDAGLFAPFMIRDPEAFRASSYETVANELDSAALVLQADHSTGGKGTFFVNDRASFDAASATLVATGESIVISRLVEGESRALQCLLLNGETFVQDWWHRDLVSIDDVYNPAVPDATRYCGAVLENIPADRIEEARTLVRTVGASIAAYGYTGVFGIDIVVPDRPDEPIILIEVNARLTAVSHLYAGAMHRYGYDTDYVTAQFNALTGVAVDRDIFRTIRSLPEPYYYLKLQNREDHDVKLSDGARLGIYDGDNSYARLGWGIDGLESADDIAVIPEAARGVTRAPGQRTFSIIGTGNPLNGVRLKPVIRDRIAALSAMMLQ